MYGLLVVLAAAVCLCVAPPTTSNPSCGLYDNSPVGVVCFHGDELTSAIATGGTGWLIEFYSSWCGHCQHFVPTWKKLAQDIAGWSPVVKLGAIDCSNKESYSTCNDYSIRGYPTMRFFQPGGDPKTSSDNYHGSRKVDDIQEAIIDRLQTWEGPFSSNWPHFCPLEGDHLLTIPEEEWTPAALIFEENNSFVGRKLMLDLLDLQQLQVYRILPNNLRLVNYYSVLEFPSLVIEPRKHDHVVVPGHSLGGDPRRDFAEAVRKHFRNIPHVVSMTTTTSSLPPSLPPRGADIQDDVADLQDGERDLQDKKAARVQLMPNRVNLVDVLGGVSYIFRREVPLQSTVTGSAFTALLRFTHLLEDVLPAVCPAVGPSLSLVRSRLETRLSAGFITTRDWTRLLDNKLNESLFPIKPEWANCRGSQSHYRGYPCALWSLAHTLTLLTLTLPTSSHHLTHPSTSSSSSRSRHSFHSKEALRVVAQFVKIFFSCEHCREHFSQMAQSLEEGRVAYDGDAVLWLWEAHNRVNRRLAKDISSDPLYPKTLFPSPNHCPYCYSPISSPDDRNRQKEGVTTPPPTPTWSNTGFKSRSESLLPPPDDAPDRKNLFFTWNRTAVLIYLWSYYGLNTTHNTTHRQVLEAAWPEMFRGPPRSFDLQPQSSPGLGLTPYDMGLCMSYYVLCGGLMVVVGYWLLRRRLRQYRRFLHP